MSTPSVAQTLDRINASAAAPTGDYFYDKLPAETFPKPDPDKPDPRMVSPWDKGTRAQRELRWHFSESAAELGERSAHESLVYRIQIGGGDSSAALLYDEYLEQPSARLPSPRAVFAAEREGRIRAALKQLTAADYGDLAMTFSLRKPGQQILGLLSEADELLEPIISHMLRTGLITVRDITSPSKLDEIVAAARARLDRALAAYEVAAGITQRAPKREPKARAALVPVGAKGASKRRLAPALELVAVPA